MQEIIKVTRHNGKKVVSAKEVHAYLEVKSKFADWFKNRVANYGFIEGQDFATVSKNLENGGREIDYAVTIGMAKELGMVERNEKGSLIRRYFIEIEERLQPDFTPINTIEDHAKPEIQRQNSKEVNTYNYEKGGTPLVISYNINNCRYHTGYTPKQLKLRHPKLKGSGKDLVRTLNPVVACNMSLTDNFVKLGADHKEAAEISIKHGTPLFQFMIKNKIQPGELYQK